MDIEKRRTKGRKDAANYRKHHPEANKEYRHTQTKLARLGKNALTFYSWLYEKEAPLNVEAATVEVTIRIKFLEICGEALKQLSTQQQTEQENK